MFNHKQVEQIVKIVLEGRIAKGVPNSKHKFVVEIRNDLGKSKIFSFEDPMDAIRVFMKARKFEEGEAIIMTKNENDAKMFWEIITNQLEELNDLIGYDNKLWSLVLKVFNSVKGFSWDENDGSIHPFSYQSFM